MFKFCGQIKRFPVNFCLRIGYHSWRREFSRRNCFASCEPSCFFCTGPGYSCISTDRLLRAMTSCARATYTFTRYRKDDGCLPAFRAHSDATEVEEEATAAAKGCDCCLSSDQGPMG